MYSGSKVRRVSRAPSRPVFCLAAVATLLLLGLLGSLRRVSSGVGVSAVGVPPVVAAPPASECTALVASWLAASDARAAARRATRSAGGANLTLFLHVPRTAGRTLFFCAIRRAFPPSARCPRSYDELRLDPAAPGCQLVGSHDDFRLVEAFAGGASTLVTTLRDPVDRLLSAYEFALGVAARGVGRREEEAERAAVGVQANGRKATPTTKVWPWDGLGPMLAADMDARLAAIASGAARAHLHGGSPYNATFYMPLHEFAAHPAVQELLHNGATFQLLGLTAATPRHGVGAGLPDAAQARALRACARAGGAAGAALVGAAATRLREEFQIVLLKEELQESVAVFAAAIGARLSGPSYSGFGQVKQDELAAQLAAASTPQQRAAITELADVSALDPTPNALATAFTACAADQRRRDAKRLGDSMARLRKAALAGHGKVPQLRFRRALVPPRLLEELRTANALDAQLHGVARELFQAKRAALLAEGRLESASMLVAQEPPALEEAPVEPAA